MPRAVHLQEDEVGEAALVARSWNRLYLGRVAHGEDASRCFQLQSCSWKACVLTLAELRLSLYLSPFMKGRAVGIRAVTHKGRLVCIKCTSAPGHKLALQTSVGPGVQPHRLECQTLWSHQPRTHRLVGVSVGKYPWLC